MNSTPMVRVYDNNEPKKYILLAFSTVTRLLEIEYHVRFLIFNALPEPDAVEKFYKKFVNDAVKNHDYILSNETELMSGEEKMIGVETFIHFNNLFDYDVNYERENAVLAAIELH